MGRRSLCWSGQVLPSECSGLHPESRSRVLAARFGNSCCVSIVALCGVNSYSFVRLCHRPLRLRVSDGLRPIHLRPLSPHLPEIRYRGCAVRGYQPSFDIWSTPPAAMSALLFKPNRYCARRPSFGMPTDSSRSGFDVSVWRNWRRGSVPEWRVTRVANIWALNPSQRVSDRGAHTALGSQPRPHCLQDPSGGIGE